MDIERLFAILSETTTQLRKGETVETRQVGNLAVIDAYLMPHESEAPPDLDKVDLEFVVIGVDKAKAESLRGEIVGLLDAYPQPERLAAGPSYIEVGGVIGSQGGAFQLFALGEVLGLWKVITPRTFGITDSEQARTLAGSGFILITGYTKEVQ